MNYSECNATCGKFPANVGGVTAFPPSPTFGSEGPCNCTGKVLVEDRYCGGLVDDPTVPLKVCQRCADSCNGIWKRWKSLVAEVRLARCPSLAGSLSFCVPFSLSLSLSLSLPLHAHSYKFFCFRFLRYSSSSFLPSLLPTRPRAELGTARRLP